MKKDNINRIGDLTEENYLFPKHLKPCVIHGALFIHNGKDNEDKFKRTELIMNKLGDELASYVMALLIVPQMMDKMKDSDEYKQFVDQRHSSTVH